MMSTALSSLCDVGTWIRQHSSASVSLSEESCESREELLPSSSLSPNEEGYWWIVLCRLSDLLESGKSSYSILIHSFVPSMLTFSSFFSGALLDYISAERSSVFPSLETITETFAAIKRVPKDSYDDLLEFDIAVHVPPKHQRPVKLKVVKLEKAVPRVVDVENM